MKIKKLIASVLLFSSIASVSMPSAMAAGVPDAIISKEEIALYEEAPMRLWYDEEAPYGQENTSFGDGGVPNDPNDGWERWSLPLGNGYFGANVFGRTATERIQLTEKTLCNDYGSSSYNPGGLNNFSETYIDFGHAFESVSDYSRSLDLRTAVSSVSYLYDGVRYEREYFTSYEDYCMVIKLTSSENGKLSFTLRPTIPYLQDFAYDNNDTSRSKLMDVTKHGRVTSEVTEDGAIIRLFGNMGQYDVDFEAQYRVFTDGAVEAGTYTTVYSTNVIDGITDEFNSGVRDAARQTLTVTNGTLEISGATEAYVVITLGTNYDQSAGAANSSIYTTSANANKLSAAGVDARAYNDRRMSSVLANSFDKYSDISEAYFALRDRHVADYSELYGRVNFTLDFDEADLGRTTDELLKRYKNDEGDGAYLEMLYYQYGRYLLIASSRETTLPANLQGTWNRYNYSPWGVGYWHNINEQMNYWHAFSTDLAECFGGYVNFINAYIDQARWNAQIELSRAPFNYSGDDTGFTVGIGVTPYKVGSSSSCGELGFTTQMFWEYYQFTDDEAILRDVVYPILYEAAQFITKTVAYNESEDAYLSIYSYSPEQFNNSTGWYYTEGTPYAQSFAYLNNLHLIEAAEILGIEDDELITEVRRQIDKYDAILVGYSGQVKEFREEDYYGEIGEYTHRHISHLVGLYPGEMINSNTPAWLDAAIVTLTERGDKATGWGVAHRLNLWSHTKLGDKTYELLRQLLKANTATNLWDLHQPFQIDGNFGAASGITEMLLQSHEGYIDPLAAIPAKWANGSFGGLVARGNFSVDASWRDGSLTELSITSRDGGEVRIHVQSVINATIRDSSGKKVSFTTEGSDFAVFDTVAGETYTVTDIPRKITVAPADTLNAVQTAKDSITLVWTASPDAKSYNIYKAIEDASDYTLIGSSDTEAFVHTAKENEDNLRATYRVTAVNADGRESTGTLAYVNPRSASVSETQAALLSSGALQVVVGTEQAADSYTLYEYDSAVGEWVELVSSIYPVLVYADYSADKIYGVSASSGFFASEVIELTDIGEVGSGDGLVEDTEYNIFSGVTAADVTLEGIGFYGTYPVSNVFDGNFESRFAPIDKQSTPFTITVTLPSTYNVKTVRIYDFLSWGEEIGRSDNTVIKVYADGAWTTLYSGVSLIRESGKSYCEFDLGFAKAEKISFTFENTKAVSSASLFEITATAAKVTCANRTELLEAIKAAEILDTALFDAAFMTRYTTALTKAKSVLGSLSAGQGAINKQLETLNAIISSAPTEGDLDLGVNAPVYGGDSAMPWDVANKIPTMHGIGGKKPSDLIYVWADEKEASFNVLRDAKYYATDYTIEFSMMLEKNATLRVSTKTVVNYDNGKLGVDGWNGGPQIIFDGSTISLSNAVVIAVDGVALESSTATLQTMENGKWYKVAIVIPMTLGERTEYIDVCINGTKYTISVSNPFYGLSYPQFEKRNAGGEAIYLDNVSQRMDAEAVYYPVRDELNELVSENKEISVIGGVIGFEHAIKLSDLKQAIGEDIRVYSDALLTNQLTDDDIVKKNMYVVAYTESVKGYENTYNYYVTAARSDEHVLGSFDCTEDKICSVCFEIVEPALGHAFTDYVYNNDAKCGVDGTETANCANGCGATDTRTAEGTALEHDYTEYVYNNDAKCEIDGTETANCVNGCGATDTRTAKGTALEHAYTEYVYNNDAKCEIDGTETANCANGCGTTDTRTAVGSALEHAYTEYVYNNDAKCEIDGTETANCANGCGATDTKTAEDTALEHKYTDYIYNGDAVCEIDGTETANCANGCGATDTRTAVGTALEHKYTDYIYNGDAVCEIDGTSTATCDNGCGATDTRVDKGTALGHKATVDAGVDPDCVSTGLTEGSHCSVCDKVLVEREVVPALGHAYDNECDVSCNVCADEREVPDHADAGGDFACDHCGEALETCDHICHSDNWFQSFIWAILRFIFKIFGQQELCPCGVKHY